MYHPKLRHCKWGGACRQAYLLKHAPYNNPLGCAHGESSHKEGGLGKEGIGGWTHETVKGSPLTDQAHLIIARLVLPSTASPKTFRRSSKFLFIKEASARSSSVSKAALAQAVGVAEHVQALESAIF